MLPPLRPVTSLDANDYVLAHLTHIKMHHSAATVLCLPCHLPPSLCLSLSPTPSLRERCLRRPQSTCPRQGRRHQGRSQMAQSRRSRGASVIVRVLSVHICVLYKMHFTAACEVVCSRQTQNTCRVCTKKTSIHTCGCGRWGHQSAGASTPARGARM